MSPKPFRPLLLPILILTLGALWPAVVPLHAQDSGVRGAMLAPVARHADPAIPPHVRAVLLLNRVRHERGQTDRGDPAAAVEMAWTTVLDDSTTPPPAYTGAIAGQVFGVSDDAIGSIMVMAWTADSLNSEFFASYAGLQPDGSYRMEGIPPGRYFVMASGDGYAAQYYQKARTASDATAIAVDDETVAGIDFDLEALLPATGAISGTVRTESGEPVVGADVYAFDPADPSHYGFGYTGPDGAYTITPLYAGQYVLQVFAHGFLSEFYDDAAEFTDATRVEVIEPGVASGIDFTLSVGGTISGYVRNAEGEPVAGASIMASNPGIIDSTEVGPDGQVRSGGYSGWGVSDESGYYRVEGLPGGEYVVMAQAWSTWSFASQWYDGVDGPDEATIVNVAVGEETGGIDFTLPLVVANSAISGTVTDEDGDPVRDAFVSAEQLTGEDRPDRDGPFVWAYAMTDSDGRYTIEPLPAGEFRVSAAAQIGWDYVQRWYVDAEWPDAATAIAVGERERVEGIDIRLPASSGVSSIAGIVRDTEGNPLYGAFVEVSSMTAFEPDPDSAVGPSFWAYDLTDSTGAYEVEYLPAGSYTVHASYWYDYAFGQAWYDGADTPETATPVELAEDEDRTGIDFNVDVRPMYGTVQGVVTTESGEPVPRAYVDLSPLARDLTQDAPLWLTSTYAVTDERGRFTMERVPEGTYVLSVYAKAGFEYYEDAPSMAEATPVQVVGGSVNTLDVTLASQDHGTGVIAGRISSEGDFWAEPLRAADPAAPFIAPFDIAVVIAQPYVSTSSSNPPFSTHAAVTNDDGTYKIEGLASGEYLVYAFAPFHVGAYYDDAYSIEDAERVIVQDGSVTEAIDFTLWPIYYLSPETDAGRSAVTVYGKVTDASGKPVEGATVHVLNETEHPVASARTGADGAFEISGVLPGSYSVYAGKIGYDGRYNGGVAAFGEASPIPMTGGRVEVNLTVNTGTGTGTEERPEQPSTIELLGNYPNPFNPQTTVLFRTSAPMNVRLVVYNVLGEEIAVLVDGPIGAGLQTIQWNGQSSHGTQVASGTYFYRLESDLGTEGGSMVLLR